MSFYRRFVLPRLIHVACGSRTIMRQRRKVAPAARGRVLEIGIGSGLNLPFYDPARVDGVWGLDPSPELNRMAARAAGGLPFAVELVTASADGIPFDDGSFDTVLTTYTLCTIPDLVSALRETARVLSPGGRLLFCEHGLAPDADVRRWQHGVGPVWRRVSGGCHLNRDIPELLETGGFRIQHIDTGYIPGWRPASFTYLGSASAR